MWINTLSESINISRERKNFISLGNNEDNLYGVYRIITSSQWAIELELITDILCVNLDDISVLEGVENLKHTTIVSGKHLRWEWKLQYIAGKNVDETRLWEDFVRVSTGTFEFIETPSPSWKSRYHIPIVHRGRTGYQQNWDQSTTTAWGALDIHLQQESLREAVEESSVLWVNIKGEYELCLPYLDGMDEKILREWMEKAIETFLKEGGKYDLMCSQELATKWDTNLIEAWKYAREVFWRNFHGKEEHKFSAENLKEKLLEIKEKKRYSFRISHILNQEEMDTRKIWLQLTHFSLKSDTEDHSGNYWMDYTDHSVHAFRVETDIQYPEGFIPLFRFYSESWVQLTRYPRVENLAKESRLWETQLLKNPTSIDYKPVPFLMTAAKETVSFKRKIREIL